MDEIQKKLEDFVCVRCNACCKQPGFVYLSEREADKGAELLGMKPFDFVNEYCELQDRSHLVLKKREDESCVFLSDEGCRIHAAKPKQCAQFPFKWRTTKSFDYCEGMKKIGIKNA